LNFNKEEERPILFREGKERQAILRIRVNQQFFRTTILASYNFSCAITGLTNNDLLVASHIMPWSKDEKNRLNPRNGICLNALHDRAFDRGLITIAPDYTIKISPKLRNYYNEHFVSMALKQYEGLHINLLSRFLPDPALLGFHNAEIFQE
jgi:putative restriction endonuclease